MIELSEYEQQFLENKESFYWKQKHRDIQINYMNKIDECDALHTKIKVLEAYIEARYQIEVR